MHEIIETIVYIVWDLWYIGIFIMMVLESSFFPFPSEVAMIPAWYLASIWEISFIVALIVWTLWALAWSIINYILWKKLWRSIVKMLIKKWWKYLFLSEAHYEKSEIYFKKHGSITTFLARFIPGIRQLISLPAWVCKMNFAKFLFYTWLGAWIWNLILMIIWYVAWENKELISKYSKEALIAIIIFWILIWIIYFLKSKNEKKKTIFIRDTHW